MSYFNRVTTKEGKPLFDTRDILDYIEEQCGYSVKDFIDSTLNELEGLREEIRDLEDKNYDF